MAGRGGIDADEVVDDGVDPRDEGDGAEGPEADDEFERRVPVAGDERLMRLSRRSAPMARPPKKAAMTAKTLGISWPRPTENMRAQTIW